MKFSFLALIYPIILFSSEYRVTPFSFREINHFFGATKELEYESKNLWDKIQSKLANKGHRITTIDLRTASTTKLKRQGISKVVLLNLPDYISFKYVKKIHKEGLILFMFEPPTVLPEMYEVEHKKYFSKVYTFRDDLVDNEFYFKFYYPVAYPMIETPTAFNNKKFCCTISKNRHSKHPKELYSKRIELIEFFESHPEFEFDLYGFDWGSENYRNYKGQTSNKTETLKNYKFSFAYENIQDEPGYITEKIFDCFLAGCVPIYLGCSNVENYIPKDCFIDRREYSSNQDLVTFLQNMNEDAYNSYIDRIRSFLLSEEAKRFYLDNFIETFCNALL